MTAAPPKKAPRSAPKQDAPPTSMIELLARAMSDPSVDVDKFIRISEMAERAEQQRRESEFTEAMNSCQGQMVAVLATRSNEQTRSRYANLADIDSALRPVYTEHGFAITYNTASLTAPDGTPMVRVIANLLHTCGLSREYSIEIPADGKGARGNDVMTKTHATGSAVAYGRRYLIGLIFNLVTTTDSDDDGQAASRGESQRPTLPLVKGGVNGAQHRLLVRTVQQAGIDPGTICKMAGIETLEHFPADQLQQCIEWIKNQSGAKK